MVSEDSTELQPSHNFLHGLDRKASTQCENLATTTNTYPLS